jgi:hypothetical protein
MEGSRMSELCFVSIGAKGGTVDTERKHFRVKDGSLTAVEFYGVRLDDEMEKCRAEIKKLPMTDKAIYSLAAGTAVGNTLFKTNSVAMAAGTSLSGAFEPVKHLLLDVADPLCYIMFVWGCIECIVGRPASGLNRMKYAGIGYIAINWIPVIMRVIREAGAGGGIS